MNVLSRQLRTLRFKKGILMKRLSVLLAISLAGTALLAKAQGQAPQQAQGPDEPPGYADVIIVDDGDGVAITISTTEDTGNGVIRCGRAANDRCEQGSPITWSIRNDSTHTVNVSMTNWTNETTGASENPFASDPSRPNIGPSQRRPLTRGIKPTVVDGTYKYSIVVAEQGTQLGTLDPKIEIKRR
jgi:hypothetical protein